MSKGKTTGYESLSCFFFHQFIWPQGRPCKWNQIRGNVEGWINDNEWLFASCCGNKAGKIWNVSEVRGDERTKVSPRQMWKFNWLSKLDTRHSSSYSLSRVGIVGVYRRWLGQHDRVDVKGRWHLGMSRNWEGEGVIRDCMKWGWSACGAGGRSNRDRKAGEEKNETNYKRKKIYSWFMWPISLCMCRGSGFQ